MRIQDICSCLDSLLCCVFSFWLTQFFKQETNYAYYKKIKKNIITLYTIVKNVFADILVVNLLSIFR